MSSGTQCWLARWCLLKGWRLFPKVWDSLKICGSSGDQKSALHVIWVLLLDLFGVVESLVLVQQFHYSIFMGSSGVTEWIITMQQPHSSSSPSMNMKSGLAGMTKKSGKFSLAVATAQERTWEQSRHVVTHLYPLLSIYHLNSHQAIQVHSPPAAGGRVDVTES